MVDAKFFMAAERNGYNGQIFEALRNRFPEIPVQVISQTLQSVVSFVKLFPMPVSGSLFGRFEQCGYLIEWSERSKLRTSLVEPRIVISSANDHAPVLRLCLIYCGGVFFRFEHNLFESMHSVVSLVESFFFHDFCSQLKTVVLFSVKTAS